VRPDGNRSSSAATDAKLPTVIKLGPNATGSSTGQNLPEIVKLGPQQQSAPQGDVLLQRIQVIDGDTIDVNGQHYRLVGIDTPESGLRAKCQRERDLSARATRRLSEIVSRGVQFERVACGCPAGTEGTPACNYGRLCGKLTSGGRDVGQILIGEGLAKYYFCTAGHCPPKQPWCS
jgi:endonuclease YncB( thermonuclease family)